MSDDTLDNKPESVEWLTEDASSVDDASLAQSGLAAFRARVRRIALPGVLVLAVSGGLIFGGLSPKSDDGETLTAAPAAVALPERSADDVSRSVDRVDAATPEPSPETTPAAAATPEEKKQARAVTQPKVLNGFKPSPTASPSASKSKAAKSARMYATATVNVRAGASSSANRIGSVERGKQISVTGQTKNGFSQVVFGDKNGWVSSQYLSRTAPTASAAPARRSEAPVSRSAATTRSSSNAAASSNTASRNSASSRTPARAASAPAPATGGGRACRALPGLQARTAAVHQALCANFPAVTSYGGVRSDWDAEHPSGRAIDAMTSNRAVGDAVANWARANAGQYGITEVIWNQRIWTTQRASEGWRSMSNRGSATANHQDHVHISVR